MNVSQLNKYVFSNLQPIRINIIHKCTMGILQEWHLIINQLCLTSKKAFYFNYSKYLNKNAQLMPKKSNLVGDGLSLLILQ